MFLIKFQFKKTAFIVTFLCFGKKMSEIIYLFISLKEPILFFSVPPNFVKVTLLHCIVDVTEEKLALKV